MANKQHLLDKLARQFKFMGLTYSQGQSSILVENGANDLTVSLVDFEGISPMIGIDGSVSPYLGIGIAAPNTLKIKSASTVADSIADVIDSVVAAKVLCVLAGFANDIILENVDATFSARIPGLADQNGLGQ